MKKWEEGRREMKKGGRGKGNEEGGSVGGKRMLLYCRRIHIVDW